MQKHIAEGRIERVAVRDALEAIAILAVEDDVPIPPWLISIPWKNDSNLVAGGIRKVVPMAVTALIKAKSDPAVLLRWQIPGELKGLLV